MQTEQPAEDLLIFDDIYERASSGKRLANYLIDVVFFYLLLFAVGVLFAIVSPSSMQRFTNDDSNFGLAERVITLVLYAFYMSVVEAIFKGKSLGKLITKTRAVNMDGSPISTSTAFSRGLSRAVPFCVFSALGTPCNPWQDRWTNTMVVNEKNHSFI
jgi:uncharacterized RDD family membrane protein YckC